jgi:hypothetical protein
MSRAATAERAATAAETCNRAALQVPVAGLLQVSCNRADLQQQQRPATELDMSRAATAERAATALLQLARVRLSLL